MPRIQEDSGVSSAAAQAAARRAAEEAAARRAAEEAARKRAQEAAARRAAEEAARRSAEQLSHKANHRMHGYTQPLHPHGKGTGPLHHAGKAKTTRLNPAQQLGEDVLKAAHAGEGFLRKTALGRLFSNGARLFGNDRRMNLSDRASATLSAFRAGHGLFKSAKTGFTEAREAGHGILKAGAKGAQRVATDEFHNLVGKKVAAGKRLIKETGSVGHDIRGFFEGGRNSKAAERFWHNPEAGEKTAKAVEKGAAKTGELVGKAAGKLGLRSAERIGAEVGERAAVRVLAETAGKAAARFVPGLNIAVAAMDAKHAYDVWNNPKSSDWQKGMATATAAFSAVSATDIPVVSQVAAGLSIATSLAENVTPKQIGHALDSAANAVGNTLSSAASTVGNAAKDFFSGW